MRSERINADVEEVRQFALRLRHFTAETTDMLGALNARFSELGEGAWADQRFYDYAIKFETTANAIRRELHEYNDQSVYLMNLVRLMEEVSNA